MDECYEYRIDAARQIFTNDEHLMQLRVMMILWQSNKITAELFASGVNNLVEEIMMTKMKEET